MQTYIVSSERDFRPGTVEMPFTSINGHPYLTDQCASLALFNRVGSQRKITVFECFFRDISAPNSSAISRIDFARISAYTGGEQFDTIQKLDPNNSNLPSQVLAVEDADSVTVVTETFRSIINIPFWSESQTTLNRPGTLFPGDTFKGLSPTNFFYQNFTRVTDIQGIILREGQGFCIMPRANAVYQSMRYKAIIKFRNVSGNACYTISEAICMSGDRVPIILWNGSGSGVVLEVYHVDLIEIGSQTFPYNMTLERIDGIDLTQSEPALNVNSLDPANESLSGLVDIRRDASVVIAGFRSGAIMARPVLRRDPQTALGGGAITNLPNFGAKNPSFLQPEDNVSHIVLHEGEGVAVFRRNPGAVGKSAVYLKFGMESTVVAGGNTYSRSRVVNV